VNARTDANIALSQHGTGRVLCTTADFHQFYVDEAAAVKACLKASTEEAENVELADAFELNMLRIANWCCQRPNVASCVVGIRSDDMIVVITASDEDPEGQLHEEMAALDLDLFQRSSFCFHFLLLRGSEAEGIGAFVNPERSWVIYRAQ
jgi:hypothetical protein